MLELTARAANQPLSKLLAFCNSLCLPGCCLHTLPTRSCTRVSGHHTITVVAHNTHTRERGQTMVVQRSSAAHDRGCLADVVPQAGRSLAGRLHILSSRPAFIYGMPPHRTLSVCARLPNHFTQVVLLVQVFGVRSHTYEGFADPVDAEASVGTSQHFASWHADDAVDCSRFAHPLASASKLGQPIRVSACHRLSSSTVRVEGQRIWIHECLHILVTAVSTCTQDVSSHMVALLVHSLAPFLVVRRRWTRWATTSSRTGPQSERRRPLKRY